MATEQETDYEAGDPSRQQTGFDDMSDDEEEEGHEQDTSFTDFSQFERFESSDELLHALTTASEDARKLLEDRVKDGAARMPRGGIPENDLYVMQHLSFFVGQSEARVHRLPNQNSRPVQILKQKVEDNLHLINRWLP